MSNDIYENLWAKSPAEVAKYALSFSGVAGKFDQARAVLDAKTLAAM